METVLPEFLTSQSFELQIERQIHQNVGHQKVTTPNTAHHHKHVKRGAHRLQNLYPITFFTVQILMNQHVAEACFHFDIKEF